MMFSFVDKTEGGSATTPETTATCDGSVTNSQYVEGHVRLARGTFKKLRSHVKASYRNGVLVINIRYACIQFFTNIAMHMALILF